MTLAPLGGTGTFLSGPWCKCPIQLWSGAWSAWCLRDIYPWLASDWSSWQSCWQRWWTLSLHLVVWSGPLGPSRLSISQVPLCHCRKRYVWPLLPRGYQQSRSTTPSSPCRRPMLLACPQHSSPSLGTCLQVCGSPSWLTPHSMAKSALRKYFTLGGCWDPESKIFLFGRVW